MTDEDLMKDLRIAIHTQYPQYKDKVKPLFEEAIEIKRSNYTEYLELAILFPFWLAMIISIWLFDTLQSILLRD